MKKLGAIFLIVWISLELCSAPSTRVSSRLSWYTMDAYTQEIYGQLFDRDRERHLIPKTVLSVPFDADDRNLVLKDPGGSRKLSLYRGTEVAAEVMDPPLHVNRHIETDTATQQRPISVTRMVQHFTYTVCYGELADSVDPPSPKLDNLLRVVSLFDTTGPQNLKEFRATKSGDLIEFHGAGFAGEGVTGKIDPHLGYVTTEWRIASAPSDKHPNPSISDFKFSDFKEVQTGQYLPLKIQRTIDGKASTVSVVNWSWQKPPESLFSDDFGTDRVVTDYRYISPVIWTPEQLRQFKLNGKSVNPSTLSKPSSDRAHETLNQNEKTPGTPPVVSLSVAGGFTGLVLAFVVFFGRRKQGVSLSAFQRPE